MNNRDMYYHNLSQGYNSFEPNGYNLNSQYTSYGNNLNQGYNGFEPNGYNLNNDLETRLSRLEKQVRNLNTRLEKLESSSSTEENLFMI